MFSEERDLAKRRTRVAVNFASGRYDGVDLLISVMERNIARCKEIFSV